MADKILK